MANSSFLDFCFSVIKIILYQFYSHFDSLIVHFSCWGCLHLFWKHVPCDVSPCFIQRAGSLLHKGNVSPCLHMYCSLCLMSALFYGWAGEILLFLQNSHWLLASWVQEQFGYFFHSILYNKIIVNFTLSPDLEFFAAFSYFIHLHSVTAHHMADAQ